MKRIYFLLFFSLLLSLFIYLFYRTEKTLVNELAVFLVSEELYFYVKKWISSFLPLSDFIIYSLPEGLWVFAITLASKDFYLKILSLKINLIGIPPIFSVGLEIFQLFGLTNGRFDLFDILISLFFWFLGCSFFRIYSERKNLVERIGSQNILCFFSYTIVYLAHVSQ